MDINLIGIGLPGQVEECYSSEPTSASSSRAATPSPDLVYIDYQKAESKYVEISQELVVCSFSRPFPAFLECAFKAVKAMNKLERKLADLSHIYRKSAVIFKTYSQHREALIDILSSKFLEFRTFCLQNTDFIETTKIDPNPFVSAVVKKLFPILSFMSKTPDPRLKGQITQLKFMVQAYFNSSTKFDGRSALSKISKYSSGFLSFEGLH